VGARRQLHLAPQPEERRRATPRERPQAPADLPEDASFAEYLARPPPEDTVTETFLDPLSLGGAPGKLPAAPVEARAPAPHSTLRLAESLTQRHR
jgi:hypothetical protein